MSSRNDPCACGSTQKYKKCCLKWHRTGLPSPPKNDLLTNPRPPGRSLGIIAGRPRWLIEEEGNYIWYEAFRDQVTGEIEERRGWFTVRRREKISKA